jgi:hypothetical protein
VRRLRSDALRLRSQTWSNGTCRSICFCAALPRHFSLGLRFRHHAEAIQGGVFVAGRWLPVMRMDWIEGSPLGAHIETLLQRRDRQGIRAVRDGLLNYAVLSELHGFAHGDIHPDNIIVSNGELKFVDYDGMYVPGLRGKQSPLAGQEDYQSPVRAQSTAAFGPWLDRFSLLSIDLSLAALERSPELITMRTPGEGLLLGKADYTSPGASRLLARMERLAGLNRVVEVFRSACSAPLESLPTLAFVRDLEQADSSSVESRFKKLLRQVRLYLTQISPALRLMLAVLPAAGIVFVVFSLATRSPYEDGRAARVEWEKWYSSLSGDARMGAEFWAGERSKRLPRTCESGRGSRSAEFRQFCHQAQKFLAPVDTRRMREPTYWRGWNSL